MFINMLLYFLLFFSTSVQILAFSFYYILLVHHFSYFENCLSCFKLHDSRWYAVNAWGKTEEELASYPMGCQAIPLSDSKWYPDIDNADNWDRTHFITCIVEGLRKALSKPFNYSNLSQVVQGVKESVWSSWICYGWC